MLLIGFGIAPAYAAESQVEEVIEEVVVTGSRIVRPNLTQPTPVTTVSNTDLRLSGTADLGALLAELPGLGSTGTMQGNSNSFSDIGGLNLPDLRRLGTSRTLTLVDGKRHVGGSPGTTAVDLNSIPKALIERVEVITGGASAVYGSDAVSGVINIITRDDFEGFEIDLLSGSADDYAENYQGSITFGRNFGDGKGNFTLSAGFDKLDDVQANDLPWADDWGTVENPDDTAEEDGIADRILVPKVLSERIDENGVMFPFGGPPTAFGSPSGLIAFDQQGNPLPQTDRDQSNSFAFGSFPNGCEYCFELEDYQTIIPDLERSSFNATINYELVEWATVYAEAKHVVTDIQEELQPSFNFGSIGINVAENPFIDPALQADLLANGIPFASMARFHADAGSRRNLIERETTRVVLGVKGEIDSPIGLLDYDLYYNDGKTQNEVVGLNRRVPGNFNAAIDAITDGSGNIVCRDPSAAVLGDNCVPFNPFGQQNSGRPDTRPRVGRPCRRVRYERVAEPSGRQHRLGRRHGMA
jgi:hypothetical protein